MTERRNSGEERIDLLLSAYREGCITPEPSSDFMPKLWERIESRRNWTRQVWHWANGFAAAAAMASVLLVVLQLMPDRWSVFASSTYVEALAEQDGEQVVLQAVAVLDGQAGVRLPDEVRK